MGSIGKNRNVITAPTHSIITLNDTTATTISSQNLLRQIFVATLYPGSTNVDVFIRYYAASIDNIKQGVDVLVRETMGVSNLFHPRHIMNSLDIYTGEISAITLSGNVDILVVEE